MTLLDQLKRSAKWLRENQTKPSNVLVRMTFIFYFQQYDREQFENPGSVFMPNSKFLSLSVREGIQKYWIFYGWIDRSG